MLKVKPSRFNLTVETQENGKVLLFNTASTALCLITKEMQTFLSEAQYELNDLPAESKKAVEQFYEMGFIVEQNVDELMRLELRNNVARYARRELTLTIGPTLNCNMCCPYCFEAERHQSMTRETAEKLIDFVKDYIMAKNIGYVHITWYGGEPLLELRRIEEISNALIPFCEGKNIPYSARIVTNGYLMDRNTAELLKSLKVFRAQITIDGLEDTHNARRKLKSGEGSFWPIVKNVEAIKDILQVVIRVNVDKENAQELDDLADFFINDMKWGKNPAIYFGPVEKYTEDGEMDSITCLSPEDFSLRYQKILTQIYEKGITEITAQNYPTTLNVGCAAICVNNFVIDANGFLYTCWRHFGDNSKSIGNLNEPSKIGTYGDYYHWLTIPIPEKCKSCVYLPICQAGCPNQRIINHNEPTCKTSVLMCIENLKLAFRNHTTQKQ